MWGAGALCKIRPRCLMRSPTNMRPPAITRSLGLARLEALGVKPLFSVN